MMQSYADHLKRAARFNDVWKPCKLYSQALDETGAFSTDVGGRILYTLTEETFGFLDRIKDDTPEVIGPIYTGDSLLTVITTVQTDNDTVIELQGIFYGVTGVRSADAHGATVRFEANALEASEIPPLVTE